MFAVVLTRARFVVVSAVAVSTAVHDAAVGLAPVASAGKEQVGMAYKGGRGDGRHSCKHDAALRMAGLMMVPLVVVTRPAVVSTMAPAAGAMYRFTHANTTSVGLAHMCSLWSLTCL